MPRKILFLGLLALTLLADTYDPALWSGLKYRMIGPERGGRVTTVTGVPTQPRTFYMGSTGGGVWKTTDAGHTWNNISDGFFAVASMGAIDVSLSATRTSSTRAPAPPKSAATSPSAAASTSPPMRAKPGPSSASATPARSPPSASIPPIPISSTSPRPGNPFVGNQRPRRLSRPPTAARPGRTCSSSDDLAGAADLELQPGDPNTLFACMWHGQRKPWTIISGALEGGIYKSTDAGEHWTKLGGGLPHELFRPRQCRHLQPPTPTASTR